MSISTKNKLIVIIVHKTVEGNELNQICDAVTNKM